MGGFGSGRWTRSSTKQTVEESVVIAINDFQNQIHTDNRGSIIWTWSGGYESTAEYVISAGASPKITLKYLMKNCETVEVPIPLQSTCTRFGGKRWWFTCPLAIDDGVQCNRRVGKLYIPPGAKYFGCRNCYDLTYQSCQMAHLVERLWGRLGITREQGIAELYSRYTAENR